MDPDSAGANNLSVKVTVGSDLGSDRRGRDLKAKTLLLVFVENMTQFLCVDIPSLELHTSF